MGARRTASQRPDAGFRITVVGLHSLLLDRDQREGQASSRTGRACEVEQRMGPLSLLSEAVTFFSIERRVAIENGGRRLLLWKAGETEGNRATLAATYYRTPQRHYN